jgi:hypothetical protein
MNYLFYDNIKWPKMWLGRDFVLIQLDLAYGPTCLGPSCPRAELSGIHYI